MAIGISLLRPSLIQMVVDSPGDMHFIQRCFRYSFRDFLKRIRTWDSNRVNRHLAGRFSVAFRQPTYDVRKVSIFLKEKVHLPIRSGP